jgi:excisionase family DNA binding protein
MDKKAHAAVGRERLAALLPLPKFMQNDEYMSVREAADLLNVTRQSLYKSIKGGCLASYRLGHTRVVLVNDLAAFPSRRANADARLQRRIVDHKFRIKTYPDAGCVGEWEQCEVCGPPADEREKPVPPKLKRAYSPERLAQLAEARERAHATNRRKREAKLAAGVS